MLKRCFDDDKMQVAGNEDGITAFQMDIKVKYYERLNAIF